jgi:hypothetical protein
MLSNVDCRCLAEQYLVHMAQQYGEDLVLMARPLDSFDAGLHLSNGGFPHDLRLYSCVHRQWANRDMQVNWNSRGRRNCTSGRGLYSSIRSEDRKVRLGSL